jgi:hypothetical protein
MPHDRAAKEHPGRNESNHKSVQSSGRLTGLFCAEFIPFWAFPAHWPVHLQHFLLHIGSPQDVISALECGTYHNTSTQRPVLAHEDHERNKITVTEPWKMVTQTLKMLVLYIKISFSPESTHEDLTN